LLPGHFLIANWMSFLEISGYLVCRRMFPSGALPSCRFLPPRVLAWWRYDAHWLRQAYRCFHTLEAVATTTGHLDDSWHSPSSSGLWPTSRYLADTDTSWHGRRLLRFRPFQRHHRPTCRTQCPTVSLIAHRFSQPPGDPDVRNDLRVYSTPLALLGSWPPEFDPRSIGNCFQPSMLLRCYLPCTAFFQIALTSA
jgi:hypothetical protein